MTLTSCAPILSGKLFFVVSDDICRPQNQNTQKSVYFCTDSTLIYTAFFADFGPVDLGLTYTFCQQLHEILRTAAAAKKSVVYYCANHPHKRANSAVLLLAYLVSPFHFLPNNLEFPRSLQQLALSIARLLVDF